MNELQLYDIYEHWYVVHILSVHAVNVSKDGQI